MAHEQLQYQAAGFDDVITKPLRCERVYLSLSSLLGVRFEQASPMDSDVSEPDATSLPAEIRDRLISAAEICDVTAIKTTLAHIERLGPEARPIVDHLRRCLHTYNFKAIASFLETAVEPSLVDT